METLVFIKTLCNWIEGKYDPEHFNAETLDVKEKCYVVVNYFLNRIDFILHLVIAPVVYIIYYPFRNYLNNKLYKYFLSKYVHNTNSNTLQWDTNITLNQFECELYHSLRYGPVTKRNIMLNTVKNAFNQFERFLWFSGDMIDVDTTGGCPIDYKPHIKCMFLRRWLYSAIRNPFYNRVWCKYICGPINNISEIFDNRCDVETSNYGTGNHRLGMRFRVYTDIYNNHYFYYEHTYKKHNNYKTHYSGVVGISDVIHINTNNPIYYTWYEHSYRKSTIC